jgi:hypothetical protein
MKVARRALEQLPPADTTVTVDTAEARRYLAEAANDNRITLAARTLKNYRMGRCIGCTFNSSS